MHGIGQEFLKLSAGAIDLFDQATGEVGITLVGHHEYAFDIRRQLTVGHGHRIFVFEVGDRAHTAQEHRHALFACKLDHQTAEADDLHWHALAFRLEHGDAFLHREQRALGAVCGNRHQQAPEQLHTTLDQVHVAEGDGIEGAGVEGARGGRAHARIVGCRSPSLDVFGMELGSVLMSLCHRTVVETHVRRWIPAAVWCCAVHVLAAGLMLMTGAPPLWLAQTGSWMVLGCAGLALLHRVFLYPPLPLLCLASLGLALQRAPRPQEVQILEPRPVILQARLREWHSQEEQSWALFDSLQNLEGKALAPRQERLLGLCETPRNPPRTGQVYRLEGSLVHDGRSFRLESFRWTVKHAERAPPLLHLRNAVRERLQSGLSSEEAGLAVALLLGERRELAPWLQETYRRFGLVHLLAVSGMHFWLWDQLLRRLLRGPSGYLRLPILGLAAALAGGSTPVMRALSVIVLRDLAARYTRSVRGIHLWAAAWVLELMLLPPTTMGLGFILSYAATGCLILCAAAPGTSVWLKTLQASWVAFLGSMPFLHMVQGTLEPWSIPLSPILGLLLPLRLCAALLALLPGFAAACDAFLQILSSLEHGVFLWLDHAPWSPWSTPQHSSLWYFMAAVFGCLAVFPQLPGGRCSRGGLWLGFLLCFCAPTPRHPGISILPVGHGLAVVIAGKENTLCFDLGSGERTPRDLVERHLYPELRARHWPVPQRAMESHGDRDHVNGFPFLGRRIPFETWSVEAGAAWTVPDMQPWSITAYGCEGARKEVRNDGGHVLDLRWGDFRAVLLGDQSGYSLSSLTRRLPPGPIDLLLVPHHGLTTAGLAPLLLHLKPARAWSSSGPRNFPLPVAPLLDHFEIPLETTLHGPLRY